MNKTHSSKIAALAAILIAAGCGGGGGSLHVPSGRVNFSGADTTAAALSSGATVPVTGGVTVATSAGSAVIPSGVTPGDYPVNSPVGVIPAGVGFRLTSSGTGHLIVNGVSDSGVTLDQNGLTTVPMALPVSAEGTPYVFTVQNGNLNTSRDLTFQELTISGKMYFISDPVGIISPFPTSIDGALPNNGENAGGAFVNASWNRNNAGRTATLDIDYGNGFSLHQTQTIDSSGNANFKNLFKDASNVPNTGVQSIRLSVGDR